MEGFRSDDNRGENITIDNNTFVGFNAWWRSNDNIYYTITPMNFNYPSIVPDPVNGLVNMTTTYYDYQTGQMANGVMTIPASDITIKRNAFVGLCGNQLVANNGDQDITPIDSYRGDAALIEAFSELNQDFSLTNKFYGENDGILGRPKYGHAAQTGPTVKRAATTIGAED
jgi:hypothetical protein